MKTKQYGYRLYFVRALGLFLALLFLLAAAKTVKVVREAQGRSGPGSYYELKVIVPAGKTLPLLEVKKSWYRVKYSGQEVWISENSLTQAEKNKPLDSAAMAGAMSKASSAQLSGAIKGFWSRYTRTDRTNLAELPIDGVPIPASAYETFSDKRSQETSRDALLKKYSIRNAQKPGKIPYVREQSIGYSVASLAAEGKLVKEGAAVTYVNVVGQYLSEATERNDIHFRIYILDTDRVNAISCPGGYILLTRGLLQLLDDESELAALLAHEMAHVIADHGMKEVLADSIRGKADDAFADLDAEVENNPVDDAELVDITNRAISIAKSPKLDKYEFEADRMALCYMARSGYDLSGQTRLLTLMQEKYAKSIDMFDLNYRNHPDFVKRLKLSGDEIAGYKGYKGLTFNDYFRANMTF